MLLFHLQCPFKPFPVQAYRVFVWLLDLYGGCFGSYLTIALENEVFKIS